MHTRQYLDELKQKPDLIKICYDYLIRLTCELRVYHVYPIEPYVRVINIRYMVYPDQRHLKNRDA